MKKGFAGFLALLCVSATACGPTVRQTMLGAQFPPRQDSTEVAVFSTQIPKCPYQEIAIIAAYQGSGTTLATALEALKTRAKALGADAVVNLHSVNSGGKYSSAGFSGTAIRFKDETCKT